jgi:hypothetical protein
MTPTELKSMSANAIEYQRALAFISLNPETEEALCNALRRVVQDGLVYLRREDHQIYFMG